MISWLKGGNPDEHCSANDLINLTIVRGLLTIAGLTVLGLVAVYLRTRSIPETFVNLLVGITTGLIGYLSRESKPGQGSAGVVTSGPVNVQSGGEVSGVSAGAGDGAEKDVSEASG